MPVTRSEAMFFAGGLAAGIAAVAAYPWLKRKYESFQESADGSMVPGGDIGKKLSETVEEFLKNAPNYVDAGKSGLQAGYQAACRMAQSMSSEDEPNARTAKVAEPGQAA